jgi:hypothetical protein
MTRLVSAYLDSHHHDEGEGLPRMPVQPNDDSMGQSIEIEVADVFCMLNIFLIHFLIFFDISSTALLVSGLARGLVPK